MNISKNWYLIGILPLISGIICYIFDVIYRVSTWDFLWVCPVTAIAVGIVVLSRNNFFISASIPWIALGPLSAFLFNPLASFSLWHFYHLASLTVLIFIVWNLKTIFDQKGFVFGATSFYSYIFVTSYLSRGEINILGSWGHLDITALYLGIAFFLISLVMLWWHYASVNNK